MKLLIFTPSKIQFNSFVIVTCTNDSYACANLELGGGGGGVGTTSISNVYVIEVIYMYNCKYKWKWKAILIYHLLCLLKKNNN